MGEQKRSLAMIWSTLSTGSELVLAMNTLEPPLPRDHRDHADSHKRVDALQGELEVLLAVVKEGHCSSLKRSVVYGSGRHAFSGWATASQG